MLWHDGSHTIHEVVEQAKARFFSVGMTTNGTYPLNAGVDTLWVSIDGLRETHNRLRNAEIFDRVINHILQSNHPRLFAHITVNNQNAAEIPALIQFLSALVKGITLQFYFPYQGAEAQTGALFLDFERRAALLDELIALKRSGYPLLNSIPALEALKHNTWRCIDWLVDNANPDGSISQGCYLRGRADIDCSRCGFSPFRSPDS